MRTIELHLVSDLGSDSLGGSVADVASAWPGTPVDYDVTIPPEEVRRVWIGVSADGLTNQVYPLDTPVATILLSWPRVYQGTEIIGTGFTSYQVFSENQPNVLRLLATCCLNRVTAGCSTVHWEHIDNVNGTLVITVNGTPAVSSDTGGEEGDFTVNSGDEVEATVTGGDAVNRLIVTEVTDGTLFDVDDNSIPVTFSFNAVCAKEYTIEGRTQGGE